MKQPFSSVLLDLHMAAVKHGYSLDSFSVTLSALLYDETCEILRDALQRDLGADECVLAGIRVVREKSE
jgi:hypothetical protein